MHKVDNLQDKINQGKQVTNHSHNLDEGIVESFEFTLFGKKYKFQHPNSDEYKEIKRLADEENIEASNDLLYSFISPLEEDAPAFGEIEGKMTGPHWSAFWQMVEVEMGVKKPNR